MPSSWCPSLPIRQMHYYYTEWRLLDIFDVLVLLRRYDLVTLTFDLLTLRVFRVQCFSCPTHTPIFIILRLSVTELRVLSIWSHFRKLKRHCACAVTRDLCIGGHPKPHVTIFWPRIAYSLYNFCGGATMTIKGSLYLSIPMLKRFSVSNVQSKSVPEMADFRKFKGPNIKYSHRDPKKALPYPERRHLTYFA